MTEKCVKGNRILLKLAGARVMGVLVRGLCHTQENSSGLEILRVKKEAYNLFEYRLNITSEHFEASGRKRSMLMPTLFHGPFKMKISRQQL